MIIGGLVVLDRHKFEKLRDIRGSLLTIKHKLVNLIGKIRKLLGVRNFEKVLSAIALFIRVLKGRNRKTLRLFKIRELGHRGFTQIPLILPLAGEHTHRA